MDTTTVFLSAGDVTSVVPAGDVTVVLWDDTDDVTLRVRTYRP